MPEKLDAVSGGGGELPQTALGPAAGLAAGSPGSLGLGPSAPPDHRALQQHYRGTPGGVPQPGSAPAPGLQRLPSPLTRHGSEGDLSPRSSPTGKRHSEFYSTEKNETGCFSFQRGKINICCFSFMALTGAVQKVTK